LFQEEQQSNRNIFTLLRMGIKYNLWSSRTDFAS